MKWEVRSMNGREKNELITVKHKMKVWSRKWYPAKNGNAWLVHHRWDGFKAD